MDIKSLLAGQDYRLSIVLGSPEVEVQLCDQVLSIRGPALLLRHLDPKRLDQAMQRALGLICKVELHETPEFIPVSFPLPPLNQADLDRFEQLRVRTTEIPTTLYSFFMGAKLLGVLPGPKLVCRVRSVTERTMLHHLRDELYELAAEVYGQPVEFLYSPVAEPDLHA